jgi:hypothetical protein
MKWGLLGWTALAFLLAMGIGAHALDELNGRPLRTQIPGRVLGGLAVCSVAGACAIGVAVARGTTAWLLVFVAFGAFVVVAYNLELFGGAIHSDVWFAAAWGAFPVLTAYFASARTLRGDVAAAALFAFVTSLAQRRLSTQARLIRRRKQAIEGVLTLDGSETRAIDAALLARAPEAALTLLATGMPLLAAALLLFRVG